MTDPLESRARELLNQVNQMPPTTSRTIFYTEETVVAAIILALTTNTLTPYARLNQERDEV